MRGASAKAYSSAGLSPRQGVLSGLGLSTGQSVVTQVHVRAGVQALLLPHTVPAGFNLARKNGAQVLCIAPDGWDANQHTHHKSMITKHPRRRWGCFQSFVALEPSLPQRTNTKTSTYTRVPTRMHSNTASADRCMCMNHHNTSLLINPCACPCVACIHTAQTVSQPRPSLPSCDADMHHNHSTSTGAAHTVCSCSAYLWFDCMQATAMYTVVMTTSC